MSQVAHLRRHREPEQAAGSRDLLGMLAVVALSGLLMVAGAVLARPLLSGGDSGQGAPGEVTVEGGVLVVRGVTAELHSMNPGMPSEMMPDPVPEGFRRVAVDISLLGRSAEGLVYDAADFRASVSGTGPMPPQREAMGRGVVPRGAQVDGVLVFELPEEVSQFRLGLVGSAGTALVDLSGIAGGSPTEPHPMRTGDGARQSGADEEHGH